MNNRHFDRHGDTTNRDSVGQEEPDAYQPGDRSGGRHPVAKSNCLYQEKEAADGEHQPTDPGFPRPVPHPGTLPATGNALSSWLMAGAQQAADHFEFIPALRNLPPRGNQIVADVARNHMNMNVEDRLPPGRLVVLQQGEPVGVESILEQSANRMSRAGQTGPGLTVNSQYVVEMSPWHDNRMPCGRRVNGQEGNTFDVLKDNCCPLIA